MAKLTLIEVYRCDGCGEEFEIAKGSDRRICVDCIIKKIKKGGE